MSDQPRPPIEYERTDHTEGEIIVRVSRAKLAVPRYSFQLGRANRNLPSGLGVHVPWGDLDAAIALLTKVKAERDAAIKADVETAQIRREDELRAWQDSQRRRPQKGRGGQRPGPPPRKEKSGTYRAPPAPDFSAAERRSAKAREQQQKIMAQVVAPQSEKS